MPKSGKTRRLLAALLRSGSTPGCQAIRAAETFPNLDPPHHSAARSTLFVAAPPASARRRIEPCPRPTWSAQKIPLQGHVPFHLPARRNSIYKPLASRAFFRITRPGNQIAPEHCLTAQKKEKACKNLPKKYNELKIDKRLIRLQLSPDHSNGFLRCCKTKISHKLNERRKIQAEASLKA